MAVKKIDHISILSKNSETSVEFYVKLLGCKIKSKQEIKNMHMIVIMLESPQGELIEIIEPTAADIRMSGGLKHIAFQCDNIEEEFNRFKEQGASMLHNEIQHHENKSFFFAKSPSGEFVEIIQYKEEKNLAEE